MKVLGERVTKLKRVFIFALLSFAMALASASYANAANVIATGWHYSPYAAVGSYLDSVTIKVEVGQNFYLGDYFGRYTSESYTYGSDLNATYKSSKTSVATINSKTGYVKALKKGTSNLTLKYKGTEYICTLKVVSKGSLGTTGKYKTLNKASKELAKYYGVSITSKNSTAIMKKYITIHNAQVSLKIASSSNYVYCFSSSSENVWKLINPSGARAYRVVSALETYAKDVLDSIKVSSVSASAGNKTFEVTLKKALTAEQVYFLQFDKGDYESKWKTSPTTVTFGATSITAWDEENTDYLYYGKCKVTKNSKKMTVTLYQDYDHTKKAKLISKYKYELHINMTGDNRIKKTFTVK
ncbi:MAG: hypothetical protein LIP12_09405 [Clostridiales bacterium]|nr:hypothetical protein [Clostridiales bacterium]